MGSRTPSRAHSRNTSYDNLLRSPIVGQGVFIEESPMRRRGGSGTPARYDIPRGAGTPTSRENRKADAVGAAAASPCLGKVAPGGAEQLGGGSQGAKGDDTPEATKTVWRWGEGADAIVTAKARQPKGDGSSAGGSNDVGGVTVARGEARKDWDVPPPMTCDRTRQKPLSSASPQRTAAAYASPASSRVHNARPPASSGGAAGGGVNGDDASIRPSRNSSNVSESDVPNDNKPLPPLGNRGSPQTARELTGKAKKLARIAKAAGGGGGDSAAPGHDGGVRQADGQGAGMDLRISRSFSNLDETASGANGNKSGLESPAVWNRQGIAGKAMATPQREGVRGKSSVPTPGSNGRDGTRMGRQQSAPVGANGYGDGVDSVMSTPARGGSVRPMDVSLGMPANGVAHAPVTHPTVDAEAVVRDCLYNSHGIVALDGYLWKPGSVRVVKRWMMLVDNTLYYFVRPGYDLMFLVRCSFIVVENHRVF